MRSKQSKNDNDHQPSAYDLFDCCPILSLDTKSVTVVTIHGPTFTKIYIVIDFVADFIHRIHTESYEDRDDVTISQFSCYCILSILFSFINHPIKFDKSYVQVFTDKVTCFLLCNALSKSLSPDSRINMFCHLKQVFYKIESKYCEIK